MNSPPLDPQTTATTVTDPTTTTCEGGSQYQYINGKCAVLVNFDDLCEGYSRPLHCDIPSGYKGLDWSGIHLINPQMVPPSDYNIFANSGYTYGVTSEPYVAYSGNPITITVPAGSSFSAIGVQATAAWNVGLNVVFEGYIGSIVGPTHAVVLGHPHDGPTYIDLDSNGFNGLEQLKITTYGGINAGFGNTGFHVVFDDFILFVETGSTQTTSTADPSMNTTTTDAATTTVRSLFVFRCTL